MWYKIAMSWPLIMLKIQVFGGSCLSEAVIFSALVVVGLVVNEILCGAISGPHHARIVCASCFWPWRLGILQARCCRVCAAGSGPLAFLAGFRVSSVRASFGMMALEARSAAIRQSLDRTYHTSVAAKSG